MYMTFQIKADVGIPQRLHIKSRSSKVEVVTISYDETEPVEYVVYTVTSPSEIWTLLGIHNSHDVQLNVQDRCIVIQAKLGVIRLHLEQDAPVLAVKPEVE